MTPPAQAQPGVSEEVEVLESKEDGVGIRRVLAAVLAGNAPDLLGQVWEHVG